MSPFGSDEGSDLLYEWVEQRDDLDACSTVEQLYGAPLADADRNGPDVDGFLIGAGLALIVLTGRIDPDGKQATLAALRRTLSYSADQHPREPALMIRDLDSFPTTKCPDPARG